MAYLLSYKKAEGTDATCLPVVFGSEKSADEYKQNNCFFPDEWEVIEVTEL